MLLLMHSPKVSLFLLSGVFFMDVERLRDNHGQMFSQRTLNFDFWDLSGKTATIFLFLCRKSVRTLNLLLEEPAGQTSAREI